MEPRKARAKKIDKVKVLQAWVKFYRKLGFNYEEIARQLNISRQQLFNIRKLK